MVGNVEEYFLNAVFFIRTTTFLILKEMTDGEVHFCANFEV